MMKKTVFFVFICLSIVLCGCEDTGDISLKGKTYEYHNGYYGKNEIRNTFKFLSNGNVYHEMQTGYSTFDTEGCSLYYKVNGNRITIYYGVIGWKPSVRNTVYEYGYYYGDYIIIDGLTYNLRDY